MPNLGTPITFASFLIFLALTAFTGRAQQKNIDLEIDSKGSIEVNGSKLDYVVQGRGLNCLVIGSSVYYPKTFSKKLRKKLRLIFVDLKWFAKDYVPENITDMTISSIVADVEAIRQEIGLEKPIIIGHSIHGTIAMEYVKEHPDKVSGLIIIGSPTAWGNETYTSKAIALWETASSERKNLQEQNWGKTKELDRLNGQEQASAEYNNMSPQYWYDPKYDASWLWDGMTVHSELTQHLFTKVFEDYDMFEHIPRLTIPVFVAMGSYDYVIPHTLWDSSYTQIPNFTFKLFEKSGHTPQLEESRKFNKVLLQWIKSNSLDK